MTNPTPHGQQLGGCPDCGSRNCVARECTRTVSHKAQAPNQPGGFSSGDMASAAAQGYRDGWTAAQAISAEPAAHVQNPTEDEHVAGDVSKNGAGLNMSAQQTAAEAEVENLRKSLVYVAFALHATPQYMLAQGITLIDGDTVRVSRDGWTVEASVNPHRQTAPATPSPQAAPLEFTKEWCMAAAKAEEDSGADISAGVPVSPQAAQQAPAGATDPWQQHMANQAEVIDCEALQRAMVQHGISFPEGGMEYFRASLGEMVNRFVRFAAPAAPSTPGAGGWISIQDQLPPCQDDQDYIGINSAGFAGIFNAIADIAGNVYCMMETAEDSVSIMSDLSIWKPFIRPLPASPTIEGESK